MAEDPDEQVDDRNAPGDGAPAESPLAHGDGDPGTPSRSEGTTEDPAGRPADAIGTEFGADGSEFDDPLVEEGTPSGDHPDSESDDDPNLGGILGSESPEEDPSRPSIEPETPELENVAFLLLGVLLSVLVIARLVAVVS